MKIQITSENIQVSPSMQTLAESKLNSLKSMLPPEVLDVCNVRVVLNKGNLEDTFSAKVEFSLGGNPFVGEETGFTIENALIEAIKDVERRYRKYKTRQNNTESWEEVRLMKRADLDDVNYNDVADTVADDAVNI